MTEAKVVAVLSNAFQKIGFQRGSSLLLFRSGPSSSSSGSGRPGIEAIDLFKGSRMILVLTGKERNDVWCGDRLGKIALLRIGNMMVAAASHQRVHWYQCTQWDIDTIEAVLMVSRDAKAKGEEWEMTDGNKRILGQASAITENLAITCDMGHGWNYQVCTKDEAGQTN